MDKETNSRLLLRASEAAHALGISKSMVVYKLAAGGELPAIRLGGSVRIPIEPLRRFIADRTHPRRWHSHLMRTSTVTLS